MARPDIAKIRARLDATNDARTPPNDRELANLKLYANARRDICLLLEYITELEAKSESATTYSLIRPDNTTADLEDGLGRPAGLRKLPPKVPQMGKEGDAKEDIVRALSQLIELLK